MLKYNKLSFIRHFRYNNISILKNNFDLGLYKNNIKIFKNKMYIKDGLSFMPNRPIYPLVPGSFVPAKKGKRGRPPTKTIAQKVAGKTFILKNFEMEVPTIGIIAKTSYMNLGICLKEKPLKYAFIYALGMKVREYFRQKKLRKAWKLMRIDWLLETGEACAYNVFEPKPTLNKLNKELAKRSGLSMLKKIQKKENRRKRLKQPDNKEIFWDKLLKERVTKEGFYLDYIKMGNDFYDFKDTVELKKFLEDWKMKFEIEFTRLYGERELKMNEWGVAVAVADGIVRVHGIRSAGIGDLVTFTESPTDEAKINFNNQSHEGLGVILSLKYDDALIGLLDNISVKRGHSCFWNNAYFKMPVGNSVCGRALSVTGQAIDGLGSFKPKFYGRVEVKGPDVIKRAPVNEPLITGWTAIDTLIPIGLGQRELILGDRQTGKTTIAVDCIYNQKKLWYEAFKKLQAYTKAKEEYAKRKNKAQAIDLKRKISLYSNWASEALFCIYVAVGIKMSTAVYYYDLLVKKNKCNFVTFVVAGAADTAVAQFMAPYAGCAIGEYLRDNGLNALIVYDDLSKHANAYRQMSLLIRRPPGREAYPGDVFYAHSKLLERSAKLDLVYGGGTLTALPIIEIFGGDYSSYIPTNVISITDGQIFLDTELFRKGSRPAVNFGLSVSRVGSAAQLPCFKQVSEGLKLLLNQYAEAELFAQFTSDLDPDYQRLLVRGWAVTQIINQNKFNPRSYEDQVVIMFAAMQGYLDNIEQIKEFERFLMKCIKKTSSYKSIKDKKMLTKNSRINLRKAFSDLRNNYFKYKKANIDIDSLII